ncbi:hypothetical protein IFM89_015517 [Coptis chinensis]|uniref:RNase H type-1 domain-containing protein n=1 Tax=Coptis chinensis TaxID=261450 RepID=A0A835MA23_9MAGN|nr:hypothetical protein IFM89_015517 [Coptis chinensis]
MHRIGLQVNYVPSTFIECSWIKPGEDEVMLNPDGSVTASSCGYGGVLRNREGAVLGAYTGSSLNRSVTFQELLAVEKGLECALLMNLKKVRVATDSYRAMQIIQAINYRAWVPEPNLSSLGPLLMLEIVPLRKVCRRPETDYRLHFLHASKEQAGIELKSTGNLPSISTLRDISSVSDKTQIQIKQEGTADFPVMTSISSHPKESTTMETTPITKDGDSNDNTKIAQDYPVDDAALPFGIASSTGNGSGSENMELGI